MDDTINDVVVALRRLRTSHGNDQVTREQNWIINHLASSELKQIVPHLSIVALHMLSALEHGERTGVELAQQQNVTKSGITRAARKLGQFKLVETVKHPDDKKKIFYHLTDAGIEIARQHDQMHQVIQQRMIDQITNEYSADELRLVARFMNDLSDHEDEFK